MIICKYNCYAYEGKTAEEAYANYLDSGDDTGDIVTPEKMQWYTATEMKLDMVLLKKDAPRGKK